MSRHSKRKRGRKPGDGRLGDIRVYQNAAPLPPHLRPDRRTGPQGITGKGRQRG